MVFPYHHTLVESFVSSRVFFPHTLVGSFAFSLVFSADEALSFRRELPANEVGVEGVSICANSTLPGSISSHINAFLSSCGRIARSIQALTRVTTRII